MVRRSFPRCVNNTGTVENLAVIVSTISAIIFVFMNLMISFIIYSKKYTIKDKSVKFIHKKRDAFKASL